MRLAHPSILRTLAALLMQTAAVVGAAFDPLAELDRYNVAWDSPSANSHGSMPIGNGDVGVNAWVEPSGDLVFYISKTDAWDECGRLCKIGRVRVKFDPPLKPAAGFRQELRLRDGLIEINCPAGDGKGKILLWVDSRQPVVRLSADFESPVTCRAAVELWRLRARPFGPNDDSHSGGGLSGVNPQPVLSADVVAPETGPRVVWYHRNAQSIYPICLRNQHLESLRDQFTDPLLNRAFGAALVGGGGDDGMLPAAMVQDGPLALKSTAPARHHGLAVAVLAERTDSPEAWLGDLDRIAGSLPGPSESRQQTAAWWNAFWRRSWVFVDEGGAVVPANAHPVNLGADANGGNRFGGQIAAPAIHDRALGASELLERKPPGEPVALPREVAPASATWRSGLTLEAWIRPVPGETGRIFDKATPCQADGFLLDTHPGLSLRWMVGVDTMVAENCLAAGQWQHVAATVDAATGVRTLYLDGKVVATSGGRQGVPSLLTRGYVLQRWMNGCSGRGGAPIKFNGSIFTVEANCGASPETPEGDPDWRKWGGNYWFQNTRLAYWPMLAAGDFEMMQPWFRMYLDALPLGMARVKTYYKFDHAAVFPEVMYFWGLPNNGDYGWGNKEPEPANTFISRYWNGGLELIAVMLDRYDYTADREFARDMLVPLADPLIAFLDQYWSKRDANGKIRLEPAQSLETWQVAVNPMPEIAGLHFLLPRLLALPKELVTEPQRARWSRMLGELPPVPVAEVGGRRLLRPAESYSNRSNSENTEMYAVFPFRLYGVGRSDLEMARATYEARESRHNHGWCQDSMQAACLGLGDEAGRLVAARAAQLNADYRFPAMWGPNFDWIPDQDHGNNILTTLQLMLLQTVDGKMYLLPAWPRNWDVSFKLHAPRKTVVEGVFRGGKLESLKVEPTSRRKDVVLPEMADPR